MYLSTLASSIKSFCFYNGVFPKTMVCDLCILLNASFCFVLFVCFFLAHGHNLHKNINIFKTSSNQRL